MFFILVSVSELSLFLLLFAWLRSVLSLDGCRSLHIFCVFLFVWPSLLVHYHSVFCPFPFVRFLHRVLRGFLPWFGVSPFRVLFPRRYVSPRFVTSGVVLSFLVPAFSFGLFFISLVRPHRLAGFSLGPFLRFLVTLLIPLLSFSPLGISCTFLEVFPQIYRPSLLRVGLFSSPFCRSVVLQIHLPRFHSLSPFMFFPSMICGTVSHMFLFCLLLRFGFPYCLL